MIFRQWLIKPLNEMFIATEINSIYENPSKIKVSFDFYWVSDVPHRKFRLHSCTSISEKNLGCAYSGRCAK